MVLSSPVAQDTLVTASVVARFALNSVIRIFLVTFLFLFAASVHASREELSAAYAAKDHARTLALARPLADSGDSGAQYLMGLLYRNGRGVERDDAEAVTWFTKAADQENASALNDLGMKYRKGEGVAKDEARALALFKRSAERGESAGQLNLAKMFDEGVSAPKDPLQARYWYERADATRFERYLKQNGRLQPLAASQGKSLPDGCKPKAPPARAMSQRGVDTLTGHVDVYFDADGKIRGVRENALSDPGLKFEVVSIFSEAFRREACRFDADARNNYVRIPFTFKLE